MGKLEPKIDPALLEKANAFDVPVEAVIDQALREAIRRADKAGADTRARKWAEENAEAIVDYNRRIRERGLVGDDFRKW